MKKWERLFVGWRKVEENRYFPVGPMMSAPFRPVMRAILVSGLTLAEYARYLRYLKAQRRAEDCGE